MLEVTTPHAQESRINAMPARIYAEVRQAIARHYYERARDVEGFRTIEHECPACVRQMVLSFVLWGPPDG